MTPTTAQTKAMHDTYCRCTGLSLKYTTYHHYVLERFMVEGHTQSELELVCKYLWGLVKKGQRTRETFNFQSLIRDEARFLDDLSQATAQARTATSQPDRESVLRSASRPEKAPVGRAQSLGEVLERPKLATMLKEWREKHLS